MQFDFRIKPVKIKKIRFVRKGDRSLTSSEKEKLKKEDIGVSIVTKRKTLDI